MGQKSWSKWLAVLVLSLGIADLVGIYVVNQKLNQPVDQDPEDDSFILAGLDSSTSAQADRAALEDGVSLPAPAHEINAPAVTMSPQQLAEIDLPLPAYGVSSVDIRSEPKVAGPSVTRLDAERPRLARVERPVARSRGFSSAFAEGVADLAPEQAELVQANEPALEQSDTGLAAPAETEYSQVAADAPQAMDQSFQVDSMAPSETAAELPPLPADADSSIPAL